MHPDVCSFISDAVYEGRLSSHIDCELQSTELGTGVRWLRAEHQGATTSSMVEAELVAEEIERLIGSKWTDASGEVRRLTPADVMVVAPYNDQVTLLRAVIDASSSTRGVPVGTVDKFQGQEAAVVFYSMATSSAADAPRGSEFLFSRNRLNVAISRGLLPLCTWSAPKRSSTAGRRPWTRCGCSPRCARSSSTLSSRTRPAAAGSPNDERSAATREQHRLSGGLRVRRLHGDDRSGAPTTTTPSSPTGCDLATEIDLDSELTPATASELRQAFESDGERARFSDRGPTARCRPSRRRTER